MTAVVALGVGGLLGAGWWLVPAAVLYAVALAPVRWRVWPACAAALVVTSAAQVDTLLGWRAAAALLLGVAWVPAVWSLGRRVAISIVPLLVVLVIVLAVLVLPFAVPLVAGDMATRGQIALLGAAALVAFNPRLRARTPQRDSD